MSNEEKLFKLFNIAQENGWKFIDTSLFGKIREIKFPKNQINNFTLLFEAITEKGVKFNFCIESIITEWEEGELSFIEALCKASKLKDVRSTHPQYYRTIWIEKPTSKRLEWLFETFNHLL